MDDFHRAGSLVSSSGVPFQGERTTLLFALFLGRAHLQHDGDTRPTLSRATPARGPSGGFPPVRSEPHRVEINNRRVDLFQSPRHPSKSWPRRYSPIIPLVETQPLLVKALRYLQLPGDPGGGLYWFELLVKARLAVLQESPRSTSFAPSTGRSWPIRFTRTP